MPHRIDLYIVVHDPTLALEELRAVDRSDAKDGEIWVERGDSKLCVLLGGGRAFLMYLRHDADPGFSSRNRAQADSMYSVHAFTLSNGQIDEYPMSWTWPIEDAFRALEQFVSTGHLLAHFEWHNDSGDGQASPIQHMS